MAGAEEASPVIAALPSWWASCGNPDSAGVRGPLFGQRSATDAAPATAAAPAAPCPSTGPPASGSAASGAGNAGTEQRRSVGATSPVPATPEEAAQLKELRRWKDVATGEYLGRIEAAVDAYLKDLGLVPDAVPFDYLDRPPRDLDQVRRNQDVLAHCTQDAFHPGSGFRRFIDDLAAGVWRESIDPIRARLQAAAAQCHPPAAVAAAKDLEHLAAMERLEGSWLEADDAGRAQLSDVVPVAGLAVGRVHRLLNEHQTVVQHWARTGNGGKG